MTTTSHWVKSSPWLIATAGSDEKLAVVAREGADHVVNYVLVGIMALLCILPFIHVFSLSFSSAIAA